MTPPDPRLDAYIARAAPFARPILEHLRTLIHTACPEVHETIKWSMPYFVHAGRNLCYMAAFKAHAAFGFWHPAMREFLGAAASDAAMGCFGRLQSPADLPADAAMLRYLRRAAATNAASVGPARRRRQVTAGARRENS